MENIYCFWLMPEEKSKKGIQSLIDKLAKRFNAVTFEPHITLSTRGGVAEECVQEELNKIAPKGKPLFLHPQELVFGDTFTQSAYLLFKASEPLCGLNRDLMSLCEEASSMAFYPHLSLLYGALSLKDQEVFRTEMTLNLEPLKFDRIQVIKSSSQVVSYADVKGWTTLFSQELGA